MQHRCPRLVLAFWAVCLWMLAVPAPSAAQGPPWPGGTLTVVTPSDVSTFDPHRALGFSVRVFANIYEPLFRKDEKGTLQGALAESWKMLDPTHLQVTLRSTAAPSSPPRMSSFTSSGC